MRDLSDLQVLEHLRRNTLGRNMQLSVLVKLLNSMRQNEVVAIDGAWGSGKTVFVRQLLMLADDSIDNYGNNTLDDKAILKFRKKQKVFYFNAWESDYLGDALGAILLKLIAEDREGLNEAAIKRAFGMIDAPAAIRNLTHDAINLESKTKKDKLVENVKSILDRHEAVNDFLDELKGSNKERIVFVVDELDRCRPSFAIDLLETIKHYFVRDDVTFVLAINTKELAHTVKKYYGNNFDGPGYLNKFFDFSYSLQPIDRERYMQLALDWTPADVPNWVARDAIEYFDLQMREINSYSRALRLIEPFIKRGRASDYSQFSIQFVFVPLALALKIKNDQRFYEFTKGGGSDLIEEFVSISDDAMQYAMSIPRSEATSDDESARRQQAIASIVELYEQLFRHGSSHRQRENIYMFNDAVSLIGGFTVTVDVDDEE